MYNVQICHRHNFRVYFVVNKKQAHKHALG